MNASAMTAVRAAAMLLCCLLGASPAPSCDWDRFEERGLDLTSASPDLGSPRDVSDAEQCKAACCSRSDCDAALVGAPQDGGLQCYLVTCWILGSDQCQLTNSSQFQVHRRRRQRGRESVLRPLLAEPKEENQTDQGKTAARPGPARPGGNISLSTLFSCQHSFYSDSAHTLKRNTGAT